MEIILIDWLAALANWDYNRFAEALETKWKNLKIFNQVHIGKGIKLAIVIDKHGKILIWYLLGLLLLHHVVCSIVFVESLLFLLTLWLERVKQC